MRTICLAGALLGAASAASAQQSTYYAERGDWTVWNTPTRCMAINRPPEDINASPYNALQISVRPAQTISVEVFFWPGTLISGEQYQLQLGFDAGGGDLALPATAFADYGLASEPDMGLWRRLQDSRRLSARVAGEPTLALVFHLDDMDWVLNAALHACSRLLREG